jgi:AcrR family transcriptional regulator
MPPSFPSSEAKSSAKPDDFGGLLEKEQLPAGRAQLAEPLVANSQRERILVAMAGACAVKGFGAMTIADVCEPAGVSRATFYELFKDKEACLEAAMELSLADAMERIGEVYSADKPWAAAVGEGTASFLDLLASRPDFARMALIEAPAAGGRSLELYAAGKRVLEALLDRGRRDQAEAQAIPASAGRGALAAAESLIVGQVLAGNTARLPELLPDIVYILTIPYLGQDEALRRSGEAERSLRPAAV